ncbi:MAG TPA: glutamate-1-semialdehyde 2,1-aminomutase [Dehalococcoidia bacterium]|nr:glutamate-1-semialdehyde 2,1-aminomutase [Dehalococcoidia bacterium]
MNRQRSRELFAEAQRYLPGGVNSPVRAFKAVGGEPLFIRRGQGSRIYDEDGNEFVDYVCSWGPLILGHSHPQVMAALKRALEHGTSFGAPTQLETTLAQMICTAMPSLEMVRFVSSGTEATMSALRLARAFTARDKVVKFAGGYHGHSDGLLARAGSGMTTLGIPDCPGVPTSYASNTLVAPYNDVEAVARLFQDFGAEIAAVIVEPVAANMGVVPPRPGFLESLRDLTQRSGALLIFDEVITGFRVAYGGAQAHYGVTPDLTCLGKVIGGGLPIGAYGGRRDIMEQVAPLGPVYQAGTLSGNPLAMTAGIETLKVLSQPGVYSALDAKSSLLQEAMTAAAAQAGLSVSIPRVGSMLTVFFTRGLVLDYESARRADTELYSRFFQQMLMQGIYWPPSQFEAAFVSMAHSDEDIASTGAAAGKAFASLASGPR